MSLSLAKNVIIVRADNRPPMLDKTNYSSWASRMLLYIKGKPNGKLLIDSVLNEPFQYGTIVEPKTETTPATVYLKKFTIWLIITKMQSRFGIKSIQGLELSLQERESKLYDDFDTFTSMPGETIHSYYMRFAQLINDMHTIGMSMKPLQVNTKFVNHLQPEWSKFVTNIKLAKDMHTTNFDHLCAHLRQHEAHANEVRLERQRYPDQIALVAYSSSSVHQQQYQEPVLQQSYQAPAIQQSSSPEFDSGLVVLSFNPSDDPIANLNKLMAFEIPTPAAFQTDDLDAFDSDSDDVPSAKVVLMANLSSYDLDVLSEVPALYDGNTIVKTHIALSVTDGEEILELAKESMLKMLAKQNDPSLKEKKVHIAPIDYVALNKLSKHFVMHFVPQK
ncbi:hypothetical protein Tco_0133199 [Tanacetum coccineum]